MPHFRVLCSECGRMIMQCRCPSPSKATQFSICDQCKEKEDLEDVPKKKIIPKNDKLKHPNGDCKKFNE